MTVHKMAIAAASISFEVETTNSRPNNIVSLDPVAPRPKLLPWPGCSQKISGDASARF